MPFFVPKDGTVVHFKLKKHTALKKLMSAYCDRQGVSQNSIRFVFDGQNIQEGDTPAQVRMPCKICVVDYLPHSSEGSSVSD